MNLKARAMCIKPTEGFEVGKVYDVELNMRHMWNPDIPNAKIGDKYFTESQYSECFFQIRTIFMCSEVS